jgi:tetratricopeptide (TPR) repeat protein
VTNLKSRLVRMGAILGLGCLLMSGVAMAREKTPKDVAEATDWAQVALAKSGYRNIQVNTQYILFGDAKGSYGIALARVLSTSAEYGGGYTWRVFWQDYARDQRDALVISPRHMDKFKAALDYLAANARQERTANDAREFAAFQAQAKSWREATVKPAMPEPAREHQVLAEYAFKEKNVDKAVGEYMSALGIFPTWPEGQYNLATLAGEKKEYDVAILHMREYLELVPDSQDAQAARDSIIIWKDKLKTVLSSTAEDDANEKRGKKKSARLVRTGK